MKHFRIIAALLPGLAFAVPDPLPVYINSQAASAPQIQLYQASPRTIRVNFADGAEVADLTGLTTNDLFFSWSVSATSTAYVATDVSIVSATGGVADFTFTSSDLNYTAGRYLYECGAGSTVIRQGVLIIMGSTYSTGTNSPNWMTNINLAGYSFLNEPWLTDANSDGTTYGRKDGGWIAVSGSGGSSTNVSYDNLNRNGGVGLASNTVYRGDYGAAASNLAALAYALAGAAATGTPLYVESDPLSVTGAYVVGSSGTGDVTRSGKRLAITFPAGSGADLSALSNGVIAVGLVASNAVSLTDTRGHTNYGRVAFGGQVDVWTNNLVIGAENADQTANGVGSIVVFATNGDNSAWITCSLEGGLPRLIYSVDGRDTFRGQIWAASTDGTGSGLDADLLDGLSSDSYVTGLLASAGSGNVVIGLARVGNALQPQMGTITGGGGSGGPSYSRIFWGTRWEGSVNGGWGNSFAPGLDDISTDAGANIDAYGAFIHTASATAITNELYGQFVVPVTNASYALRVRANQPGGTVIFTATDGASTRICTQVIAAAGTTYTTNVAMPSATTVTNVKITVIYSTTNAANQYRLGVGM